MLLSEQGTRLVLLSAMISMRVISMRAQDDILEALKFLEASD